MTDHHSNIEMQADEPQKTSTDNKSILNESDSSSATKNMGNKSISSNNNFMVLYCVMQFFGGIGLLGIITWTLKYHGSLGWTDHASRFNWHPIMMVTGMVYLAGNSILAFRVLKDQPKPLVKIIHAALHVIAFCTALFGSLAVFTNHFENNEPNLYSLHSWLGASAMTMFFFQYLVSFLTFLYPTASGAIKSALLPFHVLGGFIIFGLALMATVTGLAEKMAFNKKEYMNFSGRMWMMNLSAICLVIFAFLVFFLASQRNFKRHT